MPVKSIIDVEVKDESFKRFNELFEKYREGVKEMPSYWGDVGSEVDKAGAVLEAQTQGLLVQNQLLKEQRDLWKRQEEEEKRLGELEKKRRDIIHSMWTDTQSMAKSVTAITADMVKWLGVGSILSGLAGLGGLWGLDSLAHSVNDQRRTAMGFGVTTGQLQAARINYAPYIDVDSNLQSITEAQSDLSKRWAFNAMGVSPNSKDPAQLMVEMINRTKQMVDKVDQSQLQQFAQAHGLNQFYSLSDLVRLKNTGWNELTGKNGANAGYATDVGALQRADQVNREWQQFSVQLGRASTEIQAAFIDGLAPIVPDLDKFSKAIAQTVRMFFKNNDVEQMIVEIGKSLEGVATYLGSDKFRRDFTTFITDITALGAWVHDQLEKFHIIPGDGKPGVGIADIIGDLFNPNGTNDIAKKLHEQLFPNDPANKDLSHDITVMAGSRLLDETKAASSIKHFMALGWTRDQAAGIVANEGWEDGNFTAHPGAYFGKYGQGGDPHMGPNGKMFATSFGAFQWHEDRINQFELWAAANHKPNFISSDLGEQEEFANWDLKHGKYSWVGKKLAEIGASSKRVAGDSAIAFSQGYEGPKGGLIEANARGATATKLVIDIYNPTGAKPVVSAQQLPPR